MIQDLRRKLALYKITQEQKNPAAPTGSAKSGDAEHSSDIHNLIAGRICQNEDGSYFLIENSYPLSHLHGGYGLGETLKIHLPSLKRVCSELENEDIPLSDFLFLDTETTGLSGGAGTVAFLIGAGFFTEDAFVLQQYFMRDYDEEPAVLKALNGLLSTHKGLVTFNGKAFDWNLLRTRFTLNRIRPACGQPTHVDLLFPSRKIWKLKLESCRLSSLEENILGESRVDDIPGAMIPALYFKYLQDRDATEMKRVIKHNEFDILTMVSLLTKISNILQHPLTQSDGEYELLGAGRIFESSREYESVIYCYESCMKSEQVFVKETASRRLVDAYKRNGNYEKAVQLLEQMLSSSGSLNIPMVIELAKHYEHRLRDIPRSLALVEEAMEVMRQMGLKNNRYYEDLQKRLNRLKRKSIKREKKKMM